MPAGLSWTVWSYKSTAGLIPNSWGLYDPNHWATTPNISSDSAATIAAAWQQWTTPATFSLNTALGAAWDSEWRCHEHQYGCLV